MDRSWKRRNRRVKKSYRWGNDVPCELVEHHRSAIVIRDYTGTGLDQISDASDVALGHRPSIPRTSDDKE